MAARAVATASIAFGMVSVPCKLYSAAAPSEKIRFNTLCPKHKTKVKQQFVNDDGDVVERGKGLKGYEFQKGKYVIFTAEELKALDAVSDETIQVVEFVDLASVDPVFYEKPYFLRPEKGAERAYQLLATTLLQSSRCAIARYNARGKQYLTMIRPVEGGLVLQVLLYDTEVRTFDQVPAFTTPEADPTELAMATQLVDALAKPAFDPSAYQDEVRTRIQAKIDHKVAGNDITVAAGSEADTKGQVIDLMDALKASLGQQLPEGEMARVEPKQAQPAKPKKASKAKAPRKRKAS